MRVVDLGAGRGRQFDCSVAFMRSLLTIRGKVRHLIGIDVDPVVLENPAVDEALVYDGMKLPIADESCDLIFSDWVLEHIADPAAFSSEVLRVLKPGGWFCARTPNSLSFIAMASRLVPNRLHARVLQAVQQGEREDRDVFPTHYRMNSLRQIRKWFDRSQWADFSYTYSPEPRYNFGRSTVVRVFAAAQYVKDPFARENLFVFVQKH